MPLWFHTLKFKIVALAVVTGVLSAVGTADLVLTTMRGDIERLLLESEGAERASTAALLANKLDLLQVAITAVARQVRPELWQDRASMERFLRDKPAANALFDIVLAAKADGEMVARLVKGTPTTELPNIADRAYFQRAMKTDQPVVSEPLNGRVTKTPQVLIAVATPAPDGKPDGIIAGSLALGSSSLFSDLGGADQRDGSRSMVMDRAGILLAHPDPSRVLGRAADEPGLAEVFGQWHGSGSPINTEGSAVFSNGFYLVVFQIPSMRTQSPGATMRGDDRL